MSRAKFRISRRTSATWARVKPKRRRNSQLGNPCSGHGNQRPGHTAEEECGDVDVCVEDDAGHLALPVPIRLDHPFDAFFVPYAGPPGGGLAPPADAAPPPRGDVLPDRLADEFASSPPLFLGHPFCIFEEPGWQGDRDQLRGSHAVFFAVTKQYRPQAGRSSEQGPPHSPGPVARVFRQRQLTPRGFQWRRPPAITLHQLREFPKSRSGIGRPRNGPLDGTPAWCEDQAGRRGGGAQAWQDRGGGISLGKAVDNAGTA